MKIQIESAITLLHEASHATLATISTQLPGYPYATLVPCVLDEAQRPVFYISALAEHTRNLLADDRTSLSAGKAEGAAVQSSPRLTLIGDTERFEPMPELVARYLRYQPDAEQYVALDFMFFRLSQKRARFIGGIGRMGWLGAEEWNSLPILPLMDEAALIRTAAIDAPAGIRLLGIDCYGIDYEANGNRQRQRFPNAPLSPDKLPDVLPRIVSKLS